MQFNIRSVLKIMQFIDYFIKLIICIFNIGTTLYFFDNVLNYNKTLKSSTRVLYVIVHLLFFICRNIYRCYSYNYRVLQYIVSMWNLYKGKNKVNKFFLDNPICVKLFICIFYSIYFRKAIEKVYYISIIKSKFLIR